MWELYFKESWVPKNWSFWTVVLDKTPESPLDCKEIQPVHPKRNQSWIFNGRTDAIAETPILWPPDVKNRLIWKDLNAGKEWRWEEKGMTEDEMAGWHQQLDGHEYGWTPGVGDAQGGLACCDSWGRKESDDWVTELNWTGWFMLRFDRKKNSVKQLSFNKKKFFLISKKNLLYSKGYHQQNEKNNLLNKNIYKSCTWRGVNIQNI